MGNPNPTNGFKKGKSGNPKGRPKSEWTWSGILREFADQELKGKTKKEWVAESLYNQAIKGNVVAIKEIGDRLEGKTLPSERPSEQDIARQEHSNKLYEAIKQAL